MYSANDKITPIVTMYDYGYGKNLIKDDSFYDDIAKTQSKVEDPLNPANLGSGSAVSNLTITDGVVKSGNYVSGVSGWKLGPTSAEFMVGVTIGGWSITASAISSSNMTFDSSVPRILISDGTNNRILIGKQVGGF